MISIIVAISQNGIIGKGNELPWNYPEDLQYFKQTTINHTVVMGRNTFESILSHLHQPLPKRKNVVVTKNMDWNYPNVEIVHDFIDYLQKPRDEEIFVIGGKQIYESALPFANRLYISHIRRFYEGDVSFPQIDFSKFKLIKETLNEEISFCIYERVDD